MKYEFKKLFANRIISLLCMIVIIAATLLFAKTTGVLAGGFPGSADSITSESYIEEYERKNRAISESAKRILKENEQNSISGGYTNRLAEKLVYLTENADKLSARNHSAFVWFAVGINNTDYITAVYIFIVALMTASLFSSEHYSGVYKINFTSRNGRGRLYLRKIAACAITFAALSVVITALQVLSVMLVYDISNMSSPIQSIEFFQGCPYRINFVMLFVLLTAMRFLCFIFLASVCAALSSFFKSFIAPAVITSIVGIICFAAIKVSQSYVLDSGAYIASKYYRYRSLMRYCPVSLLNFQNYLTEINYVNVAGYPISEITMITIITLTISIILIVFGMIIYGTKGRQ